MDFLLSYKFFGFLLARCFRQTPHNFFDFLLARLFRQTPQKKAMLSILIICIRPQKIKGYFSLFVFKKEGADLVSRIEGITVEIGGDTTKLQTALQGVNKEIKSTQSQLKDVEKLLKLDPGNTELLAQKQQLLSSAVKETKEKLETLKTAAEQANTALANGDITSTQVRPFNIGV